MTSNFDIDAYLDRCRGIIAAHGHMIQAVAAVPHPFYYTVGLTPTLGYELVTIGLPRDAAQALLNDLADRLKAGPIDDATPINKLANVPLQLQTVPVVNPVSGASRSEIVSMAYKLGFNPPVFRQLIWPDPSGKFPHEAGYSSGCAQSVDAIIDPPVRQ